MKPTDSQSKFFLYAACAAAAFLILQYWRNKTKAAASTPAATLDATAGPTGVPFSPQFQYGQSSPFQATLSPMNINLGSYTAEVPSFHYTGNQSAYMPLFGFVGYGA